MERREILKIYGTDYREMTKRLLREAGLRAEIPSKGTKIGIKPNLVSPSEASYGATTHPEIVEGIIEYLKEEGFENLLMLEGSWVGDRTSEAYEVCGYRGISEKYSVPFLDTQKDKTVNVDCGGMELKICKGALDVEFLINVPVLKGHCQTKITCALKNMKGLIPNSEKRHFHAMGLHRPIAYLNTAIHQDFIVVDHICGDLDFEDGGNPVVRNCIMAAKDPVLVDSYVCRLLHYPTEEVPYIGLAKELGVGEDSVEKALIRTVGGTENREALRMAGRVVKVRDAVEEVESCSACYGYLIPALDKLREEGLLSRLNAKIHIGQGYRGKTGELGIGSCTGKFKHSLKGCPPTEKEIYEFLKDYIEKQ